MLSYERNKGEIENIFNLINTGRFYSITFIKKGNGEVRFLNGHRPPVYKKPDGSEGVGKNIGYDPKDHNLIRIWDRNALNPVKQTNTGNYRAAALENIIYIKCGSDLFDFVEENQIQQRFTYIDDKKIQEIRDKMKLDSIVGEELQSMFEMNESQGILTIHDLGEMAGRTGNDPQILTEILIEAYQQGGDELVIKRFKEMTDLNIKPVRTGQYMIDYSQQTAGRNNYQNSSQLSYNYG